MEEIKEISSQIDAVYKNLQEHFHPQTKELLTAAKAYLKALHGSTAAFSLYLDAMGKFAKSMSQLNEERSKDFENNVATRLSTLHSSQLSFLKSFYIDFILPIENNLERDVKVVQAHSRSYQSQKQITLEAFKKASSTVKKLKKKKSVYSNKGNLDKEIRGLQAYQEERDRVEEFFEKSLKEVVGMEMRRFEFVFDKQELLFNLCQTQHPLSEPSLTLSRSSSEATLMSLKISGSRDKEGQGIGTGHGHSKQASKAHHQHTEREHEMKEERKKVCDHKEVQRSQSHPTHFLLQHQDTQEERIEEDEDDIGAPPAQPPPPPPLPPAPPMADKKPLEGNKKVHQQFQKALYSYKRDEEGEDEDGFHQLLSFEEGDLIELIGPPSSFGWQYGANGRTKKSGWFPISYLLTQAQQPQQITGRKEAIYSTLEKVEVPEVDYEDSGEEEEDVEVFYREKNNRRNASEQNQTKRFFSTSCRELHSMNSANMNHSNSSFPRQQKTYSPRDLDLIISLDSPKLSPSLSRSASFASTSTNSPGQEKKPRLFTKLIKRTFSFVTMGKSDASYLEGRTLPWDDVGDEFKFDSLNVRRTVGYGGGGWQVQEAGKGSSNTMTNGGGGYGYSGRRRGRWDDLWGEDVYATRR